jgi:hypothetical protein
MKPKHVIPSAAARWYREYGKHPSFAQDDLLTWKMKVAAIWHVYQFGGRVTLFDADNKKFIVERRPDEVLKQIKSTISKIFEYQMA